MQDNNKILIIDTQSRILNRLELLLRQEGLFQNTFVDSVKRAFFLLSKSHFELIVYKINNADKDWNLIISEIIKKTDTPITYILDSSLKISFEQISLLNAYAVLVEPINKLTLRSTINIFFKQREKVRSKNSILVKDNKFKRRIGFPEIDWIKSEGNYCYVFSGNQKFILRSTIKKLLGMLPPELFIQVHRSCIIAIEKTENINPGNKFLIIANHEIPIGRKYKNMLLDRLNII